MSLKTLLPLLALTGAGMGWQHKTETEARDALKANEHSLVACKLNQSHETLPLPLPLYLSPTSR